MLLGPLLDKVQLSLFRDFSRDIKLIQSDLREGVEGEDIPSEKSEEVMILQDLVHLVAIYLLVRFWLHSDLHSVLEKGPPLREH